VLRDRRNDYMSMSARHITILNKIALLCTVVSFTLFVGCESDSLCPRARPAQITGTWGGDGIRLTAGPARVDLLFDCGEGSIERGIRLDDKGRFDVDGRVLPYSPGPASNMDDREEYRVRYQGRVHAETMTLTLTRIDTGQKLGEFDLTSGEPGRITLCL
jgi:hypothetical protein